MQQVRKSGASQSPVGNSESLARQNKNDIIAKKRPPILQSRKKTLPLFSNINQFWVLHKKALFRIFLATAIIIFLIFSFQMREAVIKGANVVIAVFSGKFVDAGFGIEEISITGQFLTNESDIVKSLDLRQGTSTVTFDIDAARERIKLLPSVLSVTIRKSYPNEIIINIVEKTAIARWRVGGQTFVIDSKGERIATSLDAEDDNLMLVIGEGANDDANIIVKSLDKYPELIGGLVAISRIADRRWDLIYNSGLRVQLPEFGVALALNTLWDYQSEYLLLNRDLSLIDLRIKDELVVRLIEHDDGRDKIE